MSAAALKARWAKFVDAPHVDWTWSMLVGLYEARPYHNLEHVEACLDALDTSGRIDHAAELALFWHDAIYVPGDKRNEKLSARLLRSLQDVLRVDWVTLELACTAIFATRQHDAGFADPDTTAAFVVDIDLSILGAPEWVYDAYAEAVRQEYRGISDDAWRTGRMGFLAEMLARPRVFVTPWGHERFERRAQENMQRELSRLEGAQQ